MYKHTKDGTHTVDTVSIDDNLIIKGDNQIVLENLLSVYKGKIKLIYIDPPYNTGNTRFKYNDNFNHSTWLSFMQSRLITARKLLKDDGVIFVSIDDNEQAYLKVLMDEVFGRDNFVADFIRKTKSTTNDAKTGVNIQHEGCLCYSKSKEAILLRGDDKTYAAYANPDNDINGEWTSSDPTATTGYYYEIRNPYTGKIDVPPAGRAWRSPEYKFNGLILTGQVIFKQAHKNNERGFILKRYKKDLRSEYGTLDTLCFTDNKFLNQVGTKEIQTLFNDKVFSNPKPEALIEHLIKASTQPNDIVLDFFLGSGTTAAVAHKMGRKYIGVEQMDYIDTIAVERLKKVIDGEQGGISKAVGWQGGGSFVRLDIDDIYIIKQNV